MDFKWGNIIENQPLKFSIEFQRNMQFDQLLNPIDVIGEESVQAKHKQRNYLAKHIPQQAIDSFRSKSDRIDQDHRGSDDFRLDRVVTESWDPEKHKFYADVVEYIPNKRLVYHHRISWVELLLLSIILPLFGGALFFIFYQVISLSISVQVYSDFQIMFLGYLITFILVGGICLYRWKWDDDFAMQYWDFSFQEGVLTYAQGKRSQHYLLCEATHVVLHIQCQKKKNSSSFSASISLVGFSNAKNLIIGKTESSYDINVAYQDGLAFAGMINNVLEIPIKHTGY